MRSRRSLAPVLIALLVVLPGCWVDSNGVPHPGNDPHIDRCALVDRQNELVNDMGGQVRCDPSYDADEQSHCPPSFRCTFVMQWNLHDQTGKRVPTVWLWQANLDDHWLGLYGWMGVCETYDYVGGRIPGYYLDTVGDAVPADVEQECFAWAAQQAA